MKWKKIKFSKSQSKFLANAKLEKKLQTFHSIFKNEFKSKLSDKPEALIYKAVWKLIKEKFYSISNGENLDLEELEKFFNEIKNNKQAITCAYIEKNNIEILKDPENGKFTFLMCIESRMDSRPFDAEDFFNQVDPQKMEMMDGMLDVFRIFTLVNFKLNQITSSLEHGLQSCAGSSDEIIEPELLNRLEEMEFYQDGSYIEDGISEIEEKKDLSDVTDEEGLQLRMDEIHDQISELQDFIKKGKFEINKEKMAFNKIKIPLEIRLNVLAERIDKTKKFFQKLKEEFISLFSLEAEQINLLKDKLIKLQRKAAKGEKTDSLIECMDGSLFISLVDLMEEIEKRAIGNEEIELNSIAIPLTEKTNLLYAAEIELEAAKEKLFEIEKEVNQFMYENDIRLSKAPWISMDLIQNYVQEKKALLTGIGMGLAFGVGVGLLFALYLAPFTFGLSLPVGISIGCVFGLAYLTGTIGGIVGSATSQPKKLEAKNAIAASLSKKPKLSGTTTLRIHNCLHIHSDPALIVEIVEKVKIRESANDRWYPASEKPPSHENDKDKTVIAIKERTEEEKKISIYRNS